VNSGASVEMLREFVHTRLARLTAFRGETNQLENASDHVYQRLVVVLALAFDFTNGFHDAADRQRGVHRALILLAALAFAR
jgi:hypothetical protein